MSLDQLPVEILEQIFEDFQSYRSLADGDTQYQCFQVLRDFSASCRILHHVVEPYLYSTYEERRTNPIGDPLSPTTLLLFLRTISENPRLARHVTSYKGYDPRKRWDQDNVYLPLQDGTEKVVQQGVLEAGNVCKQQVNRAVWEITTALTLAKLPMLKKISVQHSFLNRYGAPKGLDPMLIEKQDFAMPNIDKLAKQLLDFHLMNPKTFERRFSPRFLYRAGDTTLGVLNGSTRALTVHNLRVNSTAINLINSYCRAGVKVVKLVGFKAPILLVDDIFRGFSDIEVFHLDNLDRWVNGHQVSIDTGFSFFAFLRRNLSLKHLKILYRPSSPAWGDPTWDLTSLVHLEAMVVPAPVVDSHNATLLDMFLPANVHSLRLDWCDWRSIPSIEQLVASTKAGLRSLRLLHLNFRSLTDLNYENPWCPALRQQCKDADVELSIDYIYIKDNWQGLEKREFHGELPLHLEDFRTLIDVSKFAGELREFWAFVSQEVDHAS